MAKKSNLFMVLLAVGVIAILVMGGIVTWSVMSQQTSLNEEKKAAATAGPTTLQGKSAIVSVFAYDQSVDSPTTTKRNVPLYMFVGNGAPIVSTDTKISGPLAADATALSSSSRTDITEGITVGTNILGIAANNTYYGVPGKLENVDSQAKNYDVNVYTVATAGGKVTWYDEDGLATSEGAVNATLGASDRYTYEKIKIQNNNTDKAWNLAGFYISKLSGTNVSSWIMDGTTAGDYSVAIKSDSTRYSLASRNDVDLVFVFAKPIMLEENDQIFTPSFTTESDGDGCATGEKIGELKFFDANWYRSATESAVKFGAETDATTPADVAASDLEAPAMYCA